MAIGRLLSDFRRWLDGEEGASVAPEQPKARSAWEEFLVSIAREVEIVMQQEMFTPPGGPTYLPREYIVFLSPEDDAKWQGDKREGLERGLRHVLSDRARELVGGREVQTKSLAVELRVDGTLEQGKFRVQPVWDAAAPKTEVRPRQKAEAPAPMSVAPPPVPVAPPVTVPAPEPASLPPTLVEDSTLSVAAPTVPDSDATIVRPRNPLFSLMVSEEGKEPVEHRFFLPRISIGRGSKDIRVDLKLDGDLEISRRQVSLEKTAAGEFRVHCEGRNPIQIDGQDLPAGESIGVRPGQAIAVGKWILRINAGQGVNKPADPRTGSRLM
ncbi:MAG: FhaA domain-containing protein [Blastocatellia bacterium]